MLKLAVIGKDVSQSNSPQMHKFILKNFGVDCSYDKVSIPPEDFSNRAEALFDAYDAFNVTIPFKGDIMAHLGEVRGDAKTFGAVNTVLSSARAGYNTDGYGFILMLENEGLVLKNKSVLVLGAGGAGRSCIAKLLEANAKVSVYEFRQERLAEVHKEFGAFIPLKEVPLVPYDIIINCTGIGMHDTVGKTPTITYMGGESAPVDERLLSLCETAVDLIYVPASSEFLNIAKRLNKKAVNGSAMLFYQAYMADCIFLNKQPSAGEAKRLFEAYGEEQK